MALPGSPRGDGGRRHRATAFLALFPMQPNADFFLRVSSSSLLSHSPRCWRTLSSDSLRTLSASLRVRSRSWRRRSLSSFCWPARLSASRRVTWSSAMPSRSEAASDESAATWPSSTPALRSRSRRRPVSPSRVSRCVWRSSSSVFRASPTMRWCSVRVFSCSPLSVCRSTSSCFCVSSTICPCSVRTFSCSLLSTARSLASCSA
mmetsp:Transcript_44695/g.118144  ORF Transcript_44695/g.118144 Transcript_44695/m.118144 type:complete len:205 (-) Transcript_44695:452-1066(-)